jgi:lysophospholipase L1-like esterase
MIKVIGKIFIWIFTSLAITEIGLQLAHLVVKSNALPPEASWFSGKTRVLALGDSNTYGFYLESSLSYPSQLENIWNTNHPDKKIQVINLGYPGTSSTTLRDNLPKIISTLKPDIVLLLVGFNDRWNPEHNAEFSSGSNPLDYIKTHSRIYKLFYIYTRRNINDADFKYGASHQDSNLLSGEEQKYIESQMKLPVTELAKLYAEADSKNPKFVQLQKIIIEIARQRKLNTGKPETEMSDLEKRSIVYNGVQFTLGIPQVYGVPESVEYLEGNITRMQSILSQHGVKLYLLTYGSSWGWYQTVNTEIRRIAQLHDIPVVSSTDKLFALCHNQPPCDEYFFGDYHPKARGYQIIAEDLATFLNTESLPTVPHTVNN